MKENLKESLQFILQHPAVGSELVQHAQNLARNITLEHYSTSPQVTDEQIVVPRDLVEKLLEYSDKEYVPNTLFWRFRALLAAPPATETPHSDDIAVHEFAAAMIAKMADARTKGRRGWEECDPSELSTMLREHVEKGDPRDVANFCMMLWHQQEPIAAPRQEAKPAAADADEALILCAFQNAIRNMEYISKGVYPGKDFDLDGTLVTANIKHAKTLVDAVLPNLHKAHSLVGKLFAAAPQEQAPADGGLRARDLSKPAEQQGLFRKFDVRRVDGSDQPGGKHHGCLNYVLDVDHDPAADIAMRAYAGEIRKTHPLLASDILAELDVRLGQKTLARLRAEKEAKDGAQSQPQQVAE